MDIRRDVFQAIADPNRRAIIDLLAQEKLTVNQVAERFAISRPAISKHMKILTECGLVKIKQKGRERFCELKHLPLNDVVHWIDQHKRLWSNKLNFLKTHVEQKNLKK
jgi:DNA-binding transcriptional ArsR family regulator